MELSNKSIFISIILWFIIFVYWVIRSRKQGILNEIFGLSKLLFSGLLLYVPVFFSVDIMSYKPLPLIHIVGLLIIVMGFVVCIAGREYLSSNWSGKVIIQENHELVKNGPYKIIRHPIYSGVLCMMLGSSVILGSVFCFIWAIFCFFGLYRKSKQEEILLEEEFGEAYKLYRKETKMLIPYVL